ncbi:MAG: phenylpropionate dioxygenase-like ring-hydroxylating dioxygenase large terminal subunit [Myxococcota bacterium]|jgi:phenylpropionate dioxygenase-like ring-hydroxylating dioxygenase large terminal subunit
MSEHDSDPLAQPRIKQAWYVACRSEDLGRSPRPVVLFERPYVLFRGEDGAPAALLDRCPHRNVPLSKGTVVQGHLQCAYHGWRFGPDGRCMHIPAFEGKPDAPARRASGLVARESQGFVWLWADPDTPPVGAPFTLKADDQPGYLTVRRSLSAQGSIHAVSENALDVPHTAFLHGGLFRVDKARQPIRCRIRRWHDRVECEYIGEPRPEGIAGRLLSPSGGTVTHFDRFYLPSIVEVEYYIGDENHIILNGAITPHGDHDVTLHAAVSVRSRLPGWLLRPFVEPIALRIFGQDQRILKLQTETMRRFNDTRFTSTEIDAIGPHILRLMRQAARGELEEAGGQPYTREITMLL